MEVVVTAAVEGPTDEAIVGSLLAHVGARTGPVHGKNGKAHLRKNIQGYANAARHAPWLVLVDLDRDAECAVPLRHEWVPVAAPRMCFRVAVRSAEAWLLADPEALSRFLRVARSRIPEKPEALDDPKASMVQLASASRSRTIREDMVPRAGSGRPVGPAYTSRMIEFAAGHWRPAVAATRAESLARAIRCLRRLVAMS